MVKSDKSKQKQSLAVRGEKNGMFGKNHSNEVKEAFIKTNIPAQNIGAVCKKKNKTAGGFKWIYSEEYYSLNN